MSDSKLAVTQKLWKEQNGKVPKSKSTHLKILKLSFYYNQKNVESMVTRIFVKNNEILSSNCSPVHIILHTKFGLGWVVHLGYFKESSETMYMNKPFCFLILNVALTIRIRISMIPTRCNPKQNDRWCNGVKELKENYRLLNALYVFKQL